MGFPLLLVRRKCTYSFLSKIYALCTRFVYIPVFTGYWQLGFQSVWNIGVIRKYKFENTNTCRKKYEVYISEKKKKL